MAAGSPLPLIDASQLPADIRKAGPRAQRMYQSALAFESVLVGQLTQQLGSTLTGAGAGNDDTSDDGNSSDAATTLTAQMIPDALTQSLTASGGIGLARQLYEAMGGAKASTQTKGAK